jgi:homocysteine S-methyltransferase
MYRLKAHGLEARVRELNSAGVALARNAAEPTAAFVAGSVGPTGLLFRDVAEREHPTIEAAFRDQCDALVGAGADALLLETFRHSVELLLAVRAAVAARGTSAALVIASVSIDDTGTTADGVEPRALATQLAAVGADAVGVNCSSGPVPVLAAVERMRDAGLPLVARPNAGLPRLHAGALAYGVTAEEFGLAAGRIFAAGAAAVGGCCGTTPEHVRAIAAAAVARRSGLANCVRHPDTG